MASKLSFTPVIRYHHIDGGITLILDMTINNWSSYLDFTSLSINISSEVNDIDTSIDITSRVVTSLTGTASVAINTTTVTGVNTVFETELSVGDLICFSSVDQLFEVLSITSDTELELKYPATAAIVGDTVEMFQDWIPIYSTDVSVGTVWPDDIYTMQFVFTFGGATNEYGTYTNQIAMNSQVECAVRNLITSIPNFPLNDPCNYEWVNDISRTYMLLQALKDAGANGDVDQYKYCL